MDVALIGITHPHSLLYLETLQLVERIERIVLWDRDPEALESLNLETSSKEIVKEARFQSILEDPTIKAVLITLQNNEAPAYARSSIEAGKHVLLEKPGARSAAELEPVWELAQKRSMTLSICYTRRLDPLCRALREMVAGEAFGRIVSFEARCLASQVRFRNPDYWLFKSELAGGGMLSWLGCHWIDLLRFCLGDEIVEITGMAATLSGEKIDVEDTASFVMKVAGGAIGTIRVGYHLPISNPGYSGGSYDSYLCLNGTDGRLAWESSGPEPDAVYIESLHPQWRAKSGTKLHYPVKEMEGYGGYIGLQMINSFLDAVEDRGEPFSSGIDAVNTLRVIDAAYEAHAQQHLVRIEY